MSVSSAEKLRIKEPEGLSPRIQWLRDYYFSGVSRAWNNEYTAWTTGTPWDVCFDCTPYFIVPEVYFFFKPFSASMRQAARRVDLPADFWDWGLIERRAWFNKEVIVNYIPQEVLPGDLICGARFNMQTSRCWTEKEAAKWNRRVHSKKGAMKQLMWFHDHGYGNSGATSGHVIPGYERVLKAGWKGIYQGLKEKYNALNKREKKGAKGGQLKAMIVAATMPRDLAEKYSTHCMQLAADESEGDRHQELREMADNLKRVPWEPATTFWEAVQSLWMTHMLVMSDENYPGPGVSFGRIDQYLLPFWEKSIADGMDREFLKEIMKCFWIHANTAYDAQMRVGANQGITAGFGQLITLSGCGPDGCDMTNDLTYAMLEVIDEMSPILEPKPNVRLHRGSPDRLLDKVVEMVSSSQGAPFLFNFDERSMAGMLLEAEEAGIQDLINKSNVHDYAPVGCLENTMAGNDRSGTVDNNLNLLKAVELAMTGGKDMIPALDPLTGRYSKITQDGPDTGDARSFTSFEEFWQAYKEQTQYIIKKCVDLYELTESTRATFSPTPYLSCLVDGCAEKGIDITQGGAEISLVTIEAVTYATTVDALLAIKYLVFDKKECTMDEMIQALRDNWEGFEILQARAKNHAPKYGRDDDEADAMGLRVMQTWCDETWKYKTKSTNRRFRPGMLSWNYWVGDGYIMAASADGRPKGQFLSNAICPSNGADINGPTSNTNSVGKVLGGKAQTGGIDGYVNLLPNGASHTITFNPSMIGDKGHQDRFKAFLRGYIENGGTSLQINILDPEVLREAQKNPQDYRHLLVRVTGYNAYFTSIGRELQNEVILRTSHEGF
ncbi:MAG: pyruvate formate lyase family protein [Thermodesulfobacteriota bacterium]|nr:pyruvate formate lyase family protein [Thermodesulfobacteriota bacterium]